MNAHCIKRLDIHFGRPGRRCFSRKVRAKWKSSREADLNHRPKDVNLIFPTTVLRSTNWAIARCVVRAKNKATLDDTHTRHTCRCTLKCQTSVCLLIALRFLYRFALRNTVHNATPLQTQNQMNGCKTIQDWHPHLSYCQWKAQNVYIVHCNSQHHITVYHMGVKSCPRQPFHAQCIETAVALASQLCQNAIKSCIPFIFPSIGKVGHSHTNVYVLEISRFPARGLWRNG